MTWCSKFEDIGVYLEIHMSVCMCVYVYVCVLRMYVYSYVWNEGTHTASALPRTSIADRAAAILQGGFLSQQISSTATNLVAPYKVIVLTN